MENQVETLSGKPSKPARDKSHKRIKAILTKEALIELYINQKKSTVELATQFGVTRSTITRYINRFHIKLRGSGEAGRLKSKIYGLDDNYFELVDTHEKAYIMGFILGDGTVTDRGKSKRIAIVLAQEDKIILDQIANEVGLDNQVKLRRSPSVKDTEQSKVSLALNSTKLVNDLICHGMPVSPKSGKEPFIHLSSIDLTWSFIRGVFDADGHIRVYQRLCNKTVTPTFYTKCKLSFTIGLPFVTGLKKFLIEEGFDLPPGCIQAKQGTAVFETSNRATILRFYECMYANGSICLPRKEATFRDLMI